ncbi:MAG: hypothetical protein ACJAY7_001899 [Pseudohongiellaceae bacterium]|jgi:hypothetical protein
MQFALLFALNGASFGGVLKSLIYWRFISPQIELG